MVKVRQGNDNIFWTTYRFLGQGDQWAAVFSEGEKYRVFSGKVGNNKFFEIPSESERVYIGISEKEVKRIKRDVSEPDFCREYVKGLDSNVIHPYYIGRVQEKPESITLVSTEKGYEVKK